ncbi:MAG: helix-turn-helix transcriptional regulator [Sphingomonadaceae bacterium]
MRTLDVETARKALATLTDKQREVLDLVLEHKSSKEIGRALSISPYTVDQRIAAARQKLNVASRGEVARAYAQLREICGQSAYEFSYVGVADELDHCSPQDPHLDPVFALSDVAAIELSPPWQGKIDAGAGLEALDRRFGIFGRIIAVFGLAALIAMTFLTMVAIAQTLSKIV